MRDSDDVIDEEISAALRQLSVPPVADDFFPRLRMEMQKQDVETPSDRGLGTVHTLGRGSKPSRGRIRRTAAAAAALALAFALPVGFVLGAAVSADPGADPINAVTSFEPAPGWNTVTTTFGPSGEKLSIAWAANVAFVSEKDLSGFPTGTIRTLPPDGIVITAIGPRVYTGGEAFPPIIEPLDLSQGSCVWDEYEGQPAPNVSKCVIDTMVGDRLFNVMVWFGTTEPGDDMISLAEDELGRLAIPAA